MQELHLSMEMSEAAHGHVTYMIGLQARQSTSSGRRPHRTKGYHCSGSR